MNERDMVLIHSILSDALAEKKLSREDLECEVAKALSIIQANLRPETSFLPVLADSVDGFEID